ncbi:hypothetical protein LXL04_010668 [Taraxacum kok-saghyz]
MIKGVPKFTGVLWKDRIESPSSLLLPSNPSTALQNRPSTASQQTRSRDRERYDGDRRAPGRSSFIAVPSSSSC